MLIIAALLSPQISIKAVAVKVKRYLKFRVKIAAAGEATFNSTFYSNTLLPQLCNNTNCTITKLGAGKSIFQIKEGGAYIKRCVCKLKLV